MEQAIEPEVKPSAVACTPDFHTLFEHLPGSYLILLPDAPAFTIVAASDAYLDATRTTREKITGRRLFKVFPDNPGDPAADGVNNLRASLERAIATGAADRMPVQKYDIRGPDGMFEEHYWNPLNTPVLDERGALQYLIHSAEDVTERVRAEERQRATSQRLRISDARFRQLAEASTVGLAVGDLEGGLTYLNSAARELLGYTAEEVTAGLIRWDRITPPESAAADAEAVRQLMTMGKCAPYEKLYIAADGRRVPILVGASVLEAEDGGTEVAAFILDLTERKTIEQRDAFLVRLDDAIRSLADPDEITQTASKLLGDQLQVDRCVYCIFESDEETFDINWDYTRSGIPSMAGRYTLAQFGPAAEQLFRANLPYVVSDVESDPRTGDGLAAFRHVHIRAHASVPLQKAGRLVAALGFHQQTPRRWQPEEIELIQLVGSRCWESFQRARIARELQNSEQRLRLAQRAGKSGSFEWLIKEGQVIWTAELEALYGVSEGAFEGAFEDWRRRVVSEDAGRVTAGIQECLATRKSECDYEFRVMLPDGTTRWLRCHAQFFYDESGAPARMVGMNIDIDAQKRVDAGLRQQWHNFDTALSNIPDFAYIFDLEGRFTYVNRALLSLLELTLEDALGKNFFELGYPPELAGRLQRQIRQVIGTKESLRDETPFAGPSGETRHYEYIFVPVLSGDGRVEAVAGSTRDITDRNQAELSIERDRQRWRELLAQAPAAIAVLRGPDHRFEWVNTDYLRLVARSADALLEKTVLESLPEVEGQVYVDLLDRVYRTGAPFFGHELLFRVDKGHGSLDQVYVNFVYAPTRNAGGEIDGIFVHATDVTDMVVARKQVEESERRFRTLVDSAKDHAIIGMDLEGRVTNWNTGAERLLGFSESEILGQSSAIIFTQEDRGRKAPENELFLARNTGQAGNERWHLRKDGTRFWGSGTVTPLLDGSGGTAGFVKVFQDRTREREAREALRESEERFRQLADSMPQMVWTARPDGYLDYYNERWYAFTGFDRSLAGDRSWEPILHPDDKQRCYDAWYSAVRSGELYQIEYRFWDRNEDRWRWFMGRALPVRDKAGHIAKWFGSCTDIDEQKATQQAVLQAQKLESIGLLAGGVAHDFNNLLVGIMGGASFAMETVPSSHPAYGMLQGVVDASERAAHLTRQMLAYAGKGRFVIEPVDLSDTVVHTAELVSASIPKSVHVKLQLDEHLPTVQTDPGQMQQVAMNLIINAAEAIGENTAGLVVVRTRAEEVAPGGRRRDVSGNPMSPGSYAVLEVQDTGGGIDPGTLTKIFDPFFTTKFTGRGLGLAAVLGIVRSHQGAIEVDTAPGKGSTFRVLLPAKHAIAAKSAAPLNGTNTRGRETVLVIDDEAMVRRIAKAALETAGFTAIAVAGGEQGLEYIRQNHDISLVLLDMSMPEMSGRQVLEALKPIRPMLPVVICSGYSEDEIYHRFSGLDIAGVLLKPFTTTRLAAKVRSVLDNLKSIKQV
ncbi:MAG: PAS domain S-box protein [Acidobacteriota bacterium]|nr:PAS domain S-box protein [Acidobacteriota bacterium]